MIRRASIMSVCDLTEEEELENFLFQSKVHLEKCYF